MNTLWTSNSWFDSALVLTVGVALLWLAAEGASRLAIPAHWRRAGWQIAVLGVLGLLVCEVCGLGRGAHTALQWAVGSSHTLKSASEEVTVGPQPGHETAHATRYVVPSPSPLPFPPNRLLLDPQYSLLSTPSSELNTPPAELAGTANAPVPSVAPVSTSVDRVAHPAWLMVWLVGSALLLLRLLCGQTLLVLFARRHRMSSAVEAPLARLARRVGLRGQIVIVRARSLTGPVAFGLLRPTIGLPTCFERDFSRGEQDAMLAHEFAHLANWDPAWRLLTDIATAALWWHPVMWRMRTRFEEACEMAADEACLHVEDGPQLLAGCLVKLARRVAPAVTPGWLAVEGSGFRSSLGRRVGRLLSLPTGVRHSGAANRGVLCFLGAAAVVAATLISTAWVRPQAALTGEDSMQNILSNSWRQSLAGGLLLAVLGPAPALADDEPRKEDRPAAERREGDRPAAREGERRDGDRPAPERRDGDRPAPERRDGDRPAAERRDGDRPPAPRREGDRPEGDRPPPRREGDRPEGGRPPQGGEGAANRMQEERRTIEQQLERLRREAAEQSRSGNRENAERIEREIQGLNRRLEALRRAASDRPEGDARRPEGPAEGRRPEGQNQPRRPEGAAEGRRPDGPPEGRRPEGSPEGRRPDFNPPAGRPGFPPGEGQRDELLNVLRELRAEVQNLRNEVNDLKARMREMPPRGEGDRR